MPRKTKGASSSAPADDRLLRASSSELLEEEREKNARLAVERQLQEQEIQSLRAQVGDLSLDVAVC